MRVFQVVTEAAFGRVGVPGMSVVRIFAALAPEADATRPA